MMLVPEAWHAHEDMTPEKKAFYQYHSTIMEPWDGPASIAFTDGSVVGALLDRNGLRPSRYVWTTDDLIVVGSEVGCLEIPEEKIVKKSRLEPGRMLLVDTRIGEIIDDATLKSNIASAKPYRAWLDAEIGRAHV